MERSLGEQANKDILPMWSSLLQAVSDTYDHNDDDRLLLTRSLELSSKEFSTLNERLRSENKIIEQKVLERTHELEYEKTKLSAVAIHMDTGAILLNKKGDAVFVNNAIEEFLGSSDIKYIVDILAENFSTVPVRESVKKALNGINTYFPEAATAGRFFSLSLIALKGTNETEGALIWIKDITIQKKLEMAKNQFLEMAAHEMRTPLAVIRGNAELILDEAKTLNNVDIQEDTGSILKSAVQLLGIVNNFLDIQNLEMGKLSIKLVPVDIVKVLAESVKELNIVANEKHIGLTMLMPAQDAQAPTLNLDPYRLQQIFINIISNAIHYTKQGGVTVSIERRDGTIAILFKDTGAGISAKDQEHLFQKFDTSSSFLQTREYGSGLGLYISEVLAHLMGGSVQLEHSDVGVGSIFSLTFPIPKT